MTVVTFGRERAANADWPLSPTADIVGRQRLLRFRRKIDPPRFVLAARFKCVALIGGTREKQQDRYKDSHGNLYHPPPDSFQQGEIDAKSADDHDLAARAPSVRADRGRDHDHQRFSHRFLLVGMSPGADDTSFRASLCS